MEFSGGLAVKDPTLSLLWLGEGLIPGQGSFVCSGCSQKKKKKRKEIQDLKGPLVKIVLLADNLARIGRAGEREFNWAKGGE